MTVRVVIVDDSAICRALLRDALEADGDIDVVGEAANAVDALTLARTCAPSLVTMDIHMPGIDGLEAVARLMAETPCPILVVTGLPADPTDTIVFEATRRGALDVVAKPVAGDRVAARALRERVRFLARVPVVRHLAPTPRPAASFAPTRAPIRIAGLVASAGGPTALAAVLAELPRELPLCLAVVQHLPVGFAAAFARFLASRTALTVCIADGATAAAPGTVVLAPDDRHLVAISASRLGVIDSPACGGHRPAGDVLLRSLAQIHGARCAGVVLSGIGKDGSDGLGAIRAAGGVTIAQDAATSAVFGMPRAAVECGAALHVLAIDAIGPALRALGARRGGG